LTCAGKESTMATPPTRWVIGVDLSSTSRGALLFADWLSRHTDEGWRPEFTPVHVLDEKLLKERLRFENREELVGKHLDKTIELLQELGVDDSLGKPQVVAGWKTEQELEEELFSPKSSGLVIGRRAESEGFHLIHLGKVARRLLHSVPAPVIVVPPDLEADTIGKGPLIVLEDRSVGTRNACRMALDLADRLGRIVKLVRVVSPQGAIATGGRITPAVVDTHLEQREDMLNEMDSWLDVNGLQAVEAQVIYGTMPGELLKLCNESNAVMLLASCRRLTLFERLLQDDPCSQLASAVARPFMAVPPEENRSYSVSTTK